MVLGDSREGQDSPEGLEDEDEEEKLLKQDIFLSLEEGADENDDEQTANDEQDAQYEDEEDGENGEGGEARGS